MTQQEPRAHDDDDSIHQSAARARKPRPPRRVLCHAAMLTTLSLVSRRILQRPGWKAKQPGNVLLVGAGGFVRSALVIRGHELSSAERSLRSDYPIRTLKVNNRSVAFSSGPSPEVFESRAESLRAVHDLLGRRDPGGPHHAFSSFLRNDTTPTQAAIVGRLTGRGQRCAAGGRRRPFPFVWRCAI